MSIGARKIFERYRDGGLEYLKGLKGTGVETYFQDFKEIKPPYKLRTDENKRLLAKALSGFANSDGGCIIWGVECSDKNSTSPDVVQSFSPIKNLNAFIADLNVLEAGLVSPGVAGVEHWPIAEKDGDGKELDEGYAITYVPKVDGFPHMAMGSKQNQFFYRSGSSFEPMLQWMVASRFAKQPQPKLSLDWICTPGKDERFVWLIIKNSGSVIAREISFVLDMESVPEHFNPARRVAKERGFDIQMKNGLFRGKSPETTIHPQDYVDILCFDYQGAACSFDFRYQISCDGDFNSGELFLSGPELEKGKTELDIIFPDSGLNGDGL